MKQLKLIGFFLCLLIMGIVIGANAQKRSITLADIDDRGYVSVVFKENGEERGFDGLTKDEFNKEFKDQYTGEVFTDYKGDKYPIILSVNNKRYVTRKSRNGNWYRYYLK